MENLQDMIKKSSIIQFLLVLAMAMASCQNATNGKLSIAENGKSNYEIVCLGNATKANCKSAEELAEYVEKISGAKLNLSDEGSQIKSKRKIYVGNVNEEALQIDQISIKTKNGNIYLAGDPMRRFETQFTFF